jgi:hypothetical protein
MPLATVNARSAACADGSHGPRGVPSESRNRSRSDHFVTQRDCHRRFGLRRSARRGSTRIHSGSEGSPISMNPKASSSLSGAGASTGRSRCACSSCRSDPSQSRRTRSAYRPPLSSLRPVTRSDLPPPAKGHHDVLTNLKPGVHLRTRTKSLGSRRGLRQHISQLVERRLAPPTVCHGPSF